MMPEHGHRAGDMRSGARFVFVYGTLRAGGSNDIRRYRPAPRLVGAAQVLGTLYDLGAYPGLRLDGAGPVTGEVYAIDAALEPVLDRLEDAREDGGGEYRKRQLEVSLRQQVLRCLVYEVRADRVAGAGVVRGGDWLIHTAAARRG